MAEDLQRRYGRIHKAYCYELDSILDPYMALARNVSKQKFHLYCATENCGW